MTLWFLQDPGRLAAERDALLALAGRASWLTVESPRFDDSARLCVAIEIQGEGRLYRAELRYPASFPYSPPSVVPADEERWSGHQYGPGGELCLEHGPDNWTPELTGAHMVESAQRLLQVEAPVAGVPQPAAQSRHATTLGQDLRARAVRFVITQAFAGHMAEADDGATLAVDAYWPTRDRQHTLTPVRTLDAQGGTWSDPTVPKALWAEATLHKATAFRLPRGARLPRTSSASVCREDLAALGFQPEPNDKAFPLLLLWSDDGARLIWLTDDDTVMAFANVPATGGVRLPSRYAALKARSVGLVGCGSAGGKIAVSLARAGVGRFVLVDDDVLLPENLVRNDLDWSHVGEHKVRGVARRIALAGDAEIEMEMKRLAGQEASGVADSVLQKLQGCDLVIDATADPAVFNLLAGICIAARKPLFWLEIYAGGIGGLIARSRPGEDPAPHLARNRIQAWCDALGVPPPVAARPYETGGEADPLIADDADVGVIAAHAARLVLDHLIGASPSAFPSSAYMIGLGAEWIFDQPFDTRAIDLGGPAPPSAPTSDSLAGVTLLAQMLKDHGAQSSHSA
ncbi:ThiF family adenylyltransferase [Brevundimonas bacteroides]|uniref:ThiF family adenylyltransferase n=1 Tax=Brevundimonas bacteroides TaxID=74311 RepID=UPI00068A2D8D|nr:ThiF family adenylyltransferase [Brevundimonas bacteroides]